MSKTIWSRINSKNKSKKSTYEIAKKTNIPEDKVIEIMNGERSLPTERVDEFLNAIQENDKVEKSINMENIYNWVNSTDLKAKRLEFNFPTQKSLAIELGVNPATICRLEKKDTKKISDTFLMRYYDFLNDELNKRIEKKNEKEPNISIKEIPKLTLDPVLKDIDPEVAYDWYLNFDLRDYMTKNNLTNKELALSLGYSPSSTTMISYLCNHKIDIHTTGTLSIIKLYAYINGLYNANPTKKDTTSKLAEIKPVEPRNEENDKCIEEDSFEAEEPIKLPNIEAFNIVKGLSNEDKDYIKMDIDSTKTYIERVSDEEMITIEAKEYYALKDEVASLTEEIETLRQSIRRYEKLIDLIK